MGSSTSMSIGSVWVFDASKMDSTSVSSSLSTELSSGTPLPQFTVLLNDISNLLRFCSGSKRSCNERQLKKEIDHVSARGTCEQIRTLQHMTSAAPDWRPYC